jgi:hypothetical protein
MLVVLPGSWNVLNDHVQGGADYHLSDQEDGGRLWLEEPWADEPFSFSVFEAMNRACDLFRIPYDSSRWASKGWTQGRRRRAWRLSQGQLNAQSRLRRASAQVSTNHTSGNCPALRLIDSPCLNNASSFLKHQGEITMLQANSHKDDCDP